jgi:Peptidase family S49 N-terminal/Peptidase family S49
MLEKPQTQSFQQFNPKKKEEEKKMMMGTRATFLLSLILLLLWDGSSAFVATVRSRAVIVVAPLSAPQLLRHTNFYTEESCGSCSFASAKPSRTTTSTTQLQGLPANAAALLASTDAGTTAAAAEAALSPLLRFFLEALISNGIPALFTIVVIAFAAKFIGSALKGMKGMFSGSDSDDDATAAAAKRDRSADDSFSPFAMLYEDLYGDQVQQPARRNSSNNNNKFLPAFLFPTLPQSNRLPRNTGVPKRQYLTLTHWNPRYDSYRYSVTAATTSRATAASEYRQRARQRVFGQLPLSPSIWQSLQKAEASYLQKASELEREIQTLQQRARVIALNAGYTQLGLNVTADPYEIDPATTTRTPMTTTTAITTIVAAVTTASNSTTTVEPPPQPPMKSTMANEVVAVAKKIGLAVANQQQLEVTFLQTVTTLVGPEQAPVVRAAILGDRLAGGGSSRSLVGSSSSGGRPLTRFLTHYDPNTSNEQESHQTQPPPMTKRLFIARFPGDVAASQVNNLRQEVTGILLAAQPGTVDEVLIVLQSGGGTVTGYGLAAAQLQRLKTAGIPLTIAVEQVAASGGYMMACLADKIVASPFAVLGSIGVISDIPNVYERLKREGIEFQTVTAGKLYVIVVSCRFEWLGVSLTRSLFV